MCYGPPLASPSVLSRTMNAITGYKENPGGLAEHKAARDRALLWSASEWEIRALIGMNFERFPAKYVNAWSA